MSIYVSFVIKNKIKVWWHIENDYTPLCLMPSLCCIFSSAWEIWKIFTSDRKIIAKQPGQYRWWNTAVSLDDAKSCDDKESKKDGKLPMKYGKVAMRSSEEAEESTWCSLIWGRWAAM